MKLKKINILNKNQHSLCLLLENEWIAFRAVLTAVTADGSAEREKLEKAADDMVAFLKDREILEPKLMELIRLAKKSGTRLVLEGKDTMPFRPLFYRDFMLCERHVVQSSKGFAKLMFPKLMPLLRFLQAFSRKPLKFFRPSKVWYEYPNYYKGNILSFVGDGETVSFPKYATVKDYELELGMLITKEVFNPTEAEALAAIGGFCVFNDFSARNVQYAELRKTGFGPCKSKDFCSSISNVVVTADEILSILETLKTRVFINEKLVAEGQLNEFYHSLGKAVAYAALGERVYPGEFMGSGTVPNCCGIENGLLLECGDTIRLEIDKVGTLTNPIGKDLV